jgi:hypothetical protein
MHMRLRRSAAAALVTVGIITAGLVATPADAKPGNGNANGHGKGHCRAFHARGEGTDDGGGTTTATILRGNREIGTTVGHFTPDGMDGTLVSFTGTITFSNDHGTLVAPVEGTLDIATGEFRSSSDTVTGTADYADVTGRLRFWGVEDLTALTFTETIHGKLCVPKKKPH